MGRVTTIGYEAADLSSFLACLKAAKIEVLIDVRELPLSRRRGFSKSALRMALADHKIGYVHLRDLGDPPPGRAAARAGKIEKFVRIFKRHLKTKAAQEALEAACKLARSATISLMCFERNPVTCHRLMVAAAIRDIIGGVPVDHLFAPTPVRAVQRNKRKNTDPRKGPSSRRSSPRGNGLLRGRHREAAVA